MGICTPPGVGTLRWEASPLRLALLLCHSWSLLKCGRARLSKSHLGINGFTWRARSVLGKRWRRVPRSHSGTGFVPSHLPHRAAEWARRPGLWLHGRMEPPEAVHPLLPHQLHGRGPCLPDENHCLRGALQGPALLRQVQPALASSCPQRSHAHRGVCWCSFVLVLWRTPSWTARRQWDDMNCCEAFHLVTRTTSNCILFLDCKRAQAVLTSLYGWFMSFFFNTLAVFMYLFWVSDRLFLIQKPPAKINKMLALNWIFGLLGAHVAMTIVVKKILWTFLRKTIQIQ